MKLIVADGKRRQTDVANTEQLLRIIQSVPSKKAEPLTNTRMKPLMLDWTERENIGLRKPLKTVLAPCAQSNEIKNIHLVNYRGMGDLTVDQIAPDRY